jgi:hypothetical protein
MSTKCYFFLDTEFLEFYTFVNCKVCLAGSMSTRKRENRNNGNQESSKEASEEGSSQENCEEEVSRQRNRQHNRGTPKASPDVLWAEVDIANVHAAAAEVTPAPQFTAGARFCSRTGLSIRRSQACAPRCRPSTNGSVAARPTVRAWAANRPTSPGVCRY